MQDLFNLFQFFLIVFAIGLPLTFLYFTVMGRLNSWLSNINKRQDEEALATTKEVMTNKRAEEIVYASATYLGHGYPQIKDERLLPFPKEQIIAAFEYRIEFLNRIRDADPAQFAQSPQAGDITDMECLILHFLRFGPIDPEDQQKVDEINADKDHFDDIFNRHTQGETTEEENVWLSEAFDLVLKYTFPIQQSSPRARL